jgi:hypothetical protein
MQLHYLCSTPVTLFVFFVVLAEKVVILLFLLVRHHSETVGNLLFPQQPLCVPLLPLGKFSLLLASKTKVCFIPVVMVEDGVNDDR